MGDFKHFLAENRESDAWSSLRNLPSKHRRLVRGFRIEFQQGHTLKGDDEHIGQIVTHPEKVITLASPWHYPKEFALLHEVGHLVWENFVKGTPLEREWKDIVARTKDKANQNAEELFCHSYASTYGRHGIVKHHHEEWVNFIKRLAK